MSAAHLRGGGRGRLRGAVVALARWRLAVLVAWAVLALCGIAANAALPGLLSTSLAVPGTSSQRADAVLAQRFGENVEGGFTIVAPLATSDPGAGAAFGARVRAAVRAVPGARVTSVTALQGIVEVQVTTPLGLGAAAAQTGRLRRALAAHGLRRAVVTGAAALQHDVTPVLAADLRRGEVIAATVALVVLVAVLGLSPLVLVPLAIAAATTGAALVLVWALAHGVLMVLYVPNLVELIGLGVAIDYSLLVVHRFREEAALRASFAEALVETMRRAGRTIVVSGLAVTLGLCALFVVPVPFVRSLGVAALAVPLVAVAVTLTLAPALLALIYRGRLPSAGVAPECTARWRRLGRAIVAHRIAVIVATLVVLVALALPVAWLRVTPGSLSAIPGRLPAARGLALLSARAGAGALTPLEIVIDAGKDGAALAPPESAATLRLARALLADPAVELVAIGSRPPYVDPSRRARLVVAVARQDFGAPETTALVRALRGHLVAAAGFPPGTTVLVGGAPAQGVDFLARVDGTFPLVVLVVLALAFVALARAFRSLVLALGAIVLDALSVGATYGLLVIVFRFGVGADLLGLYRVGALEGWVPVFLFALLFGLSMDYEVFLVSRMREAHEAGAPTADAVVEAVGRTGRIVSAAALIMIGALSGLWVGKVAGLQELGVGLALGVGLDAFVVRGLLLPSLVAVLGRANWWLPAPLRRVLLLGPARPPPATGGRALDA